MAYATVDDLEVRWRTLMEDEIDTAEVLLEDAKVIIDQAVQDPSAVDAAILRLVSCDIVRRAMMADSDSFALGSTEPDAMAWTPREAASTSLWLTYDNKRMLGCFSASAFSIRPKMDAPYGR